MSQSKKWWTDMPSELQKDIESEEQIN